MFGSHNRQESSPQEEGEEHGQEESQQTGTPAGGLPLLSKLPPCKELSSTVWGTLADGLLTVAGLWFPSSQTRTLLLPCSAHSHTSEAQAEWPEEKLSGFWCSLFCVQASEIHGRLRLQTLALQTWVSLRWLWRLLTPARPAKGCPQASSHPPSDGQHLSCNATARWHLRGHPPKPPSSVQSKARVTAGAHSGQGKIPTNPNCFLKKLNLMDFKPYIRRKLMGKYDVMTLSHAHQLKAPVTPRSITSYSASRKGKQLTDVHLRALPWTRDSASSQADFICCGKHSAPLENSPSDGMKSAHKKSDHQDRSSDAYAQLSRSWSTEQPTARGHLSWHLPAPREDSYLSQQPDTTCECSPEAECCH